MASLISPGVSVTVIDESQYTSTAIGTIPYILVATAQDKLNTSGTLASYTTKANAKKVFVISSQRDLIQNFGTPTFYTDAAGNPLHGDERNEYGLLAAYSALGVGNQVLIQRADIDVAQLVGTSVRPTGTPSNGSYWLDLENSAYGIHEWDPEVGFSIYEPTYITDVNHLSGSVPVNSYGSIGDYAVVSYSTSNPIYFKRYDNTWVAVGSNDWKKSHPAMTGYIINASNVAIGQRLRINSTNVAMTGTTIAQAAADITAASIQGVVATVSDIGQLELRIDSTSASSGNVLLPDGKVKVDLGIGYPDAARNLGLLNSTETTKTKYAPILQYGTYVDTPAWRDSDAIPRPAGSIWLKTTVKGNGASWGIKQYSESLDSWQLLTAPLYSSDSAAIRSLDPVGGGGQLAVGSVYVKYDVLNVNGTNDPQLTFKPYVKTTTGILTVTGKIPSSPFVFTNLNSFSMTVSVPGSADTSATIVIQGTTSAAFVQAIQSARLPNISATIGSSGAISISHLAGGTIRFDYGVGTPLVTAGFTAGTQAACANGIQLLSANTVYLASPFEELTYIPSTIAPYANPKDDTLWYFSNPLDVDIMVNDGSGWKGYRNVINDARGFNLSLTDPNGVILSASTPVAQSDNTALVSGDLWIDTSRLHEFPVLHRYDEAFGWVLIDNSDDVDANGITFADARWASNGTTDSIVDDLPDIQTLLGSDYLDPDAPDYRLFSRGTLLFNTRRSGYNVKRFDSQYFTTQPASFTGDSYVAPDNVSAWISYSGIDNSTGVPYFGHKAQRNTIVEAMKSAIDSSTDLREEQIEFNLIVSPNYPELMQNMIVLNNDRKQTAFIIGDSPMDVPSNSNVLSQWASNYNLSVDNNANGLVSHSDYLGVFYPSGFSSDLSGNYAVVPPSHMLLRTIIRSDNVSYPWFAPAGVRRGIIDNATAIGYINKNDQNAFVSIGVTNSLRDILYHNNVNPISVLPGVGPVVYGQKTRATMESAMDRINVARLVCYLRVVLDRIARPYIFEPNDTITRNQVKQSFEKVLNDLVAKRGITDYSVVCDTSNNTSDRIARNELWIDIAIEPTRAIEFIYIPVRLMNPGAIGG